MSLRPSLRSGAVRLGVGVTLLAAVAVPQDAWLPRYDLDGAAPEVHSLARPLAEVSGLAFDDRGRMYAHDDELARVHQLDPATGRIVRSISVGGAMRGDFEGLAIVGRRFFLITGLGTIVEFEVADADADAARVARRVATGLGSRCETEGLAFDPATGSLLAPCKTPHGRALADQLAIFAIPLATLVAPPRPRFMVPFDALARAGVRNGFHPSSIEIHPRSGSLFLASAQEEMLVELTPDGRVLGAKRLSRRAHPQPEGIAFGPDLSLWIADEGGEGRGTLARYPLDPARMGR